MAVLRAPVAVSAIQVHNLYRQCLPRQIRMAGKHRRAIPMHPNTNTVGGRPAKTTLISGNEQAQSVAKPSSIVQDSALLLVFHPERCEKV